MLAGVSLLCELGRGEGAGAAVQGIQGRFSAKVFISFKSFLDAFFHNHTY